MKNISLIIISLLISLVCAFAHTNDKHSISCYAKYKNNEFYGFGDSATVRGVLNKQFVSMFSKRWHSKKQKEDVKRYIVPLLSKTDTDTITVITLFYLSVESYSVIKINDSIRILSYNFNDDEKDILIPSDTFIVTDQVTLDNTSVIMYNVMFLWNIDDIYCLLESSNPNAGGEYGWKAERFITEKGKIINYESISYGECLIWNLKKCYGKDYPDKFLKDYRYNCEDSLITKYLPAILFPNIFKSGTEE